MYVGLDWFYWVMMAPVMLLAVYAQMKVKSV